MAKGKKSESAERQIIKCIYKGDVDAEGRPHGQGVMDYIVERHPDDTFPEEGNMRYRGEFVHGLRHGDGDLHSRGLMNNPTSEYEWYAEGDYDSCGRFMRSAHPAGSWKRLVECWYPSFEGQWKDDLPLESRWEKGKALHIKELHWRDIRRTTFEAIQGIPLDIAL